MSDTFGGVLLVHYAFLQVTGCLMLLMCSPMDSESFARYGPLTVYCFQQLIQSSIIFELLDSSNDALSLAIYNVRWECMDTKNRKILYVMLLQSQRPMKLKAMNMITVGVQTMITILKTSFSYFLMIKTFAEG
ncbi:uncharacterized protein LOC142986621 [Anticarsia gemmatalis]|uniref:uncharacterized protein LOC142986621 n=1 Tax=Anticarsia gemmatalis TaxID=129554 RepID=UPI003F75C795